MTEINDLFDRLELVGEEGGKSFFTTRKAEFEYLWGDNKKAISLAQEAISKTPSIFEPRRIEALAYLKDGNRNKAHETIEIMREMVNTRESGERKSNYRSYLEILSQYYTEVGQYGPAKAIYDDNSVFTADEKSVAVREIEIIQGYKSKR